jgi:hypothetical protein
MNMLRDEPTRSGVLPADPQPREEPIGTDQDPARPGGRGSALTFFAVSLAFAVLLALFFHAYGSC